jgi:hypothetical protein
MWKETVLPALRHCSNMCFEDVRKTTTVSVMTSNPGLMSPEHEAEKLTLQYMFSYAQLNSRPSSVYYPLTSSFPPIKYGLL